MKNLIVLLLIAFSFSQIAYADNFICTLKVSSSRLTPDVKSIIQGKGYKLILEAEGPAKFSLRIDDGLRFVTEKVERCSFSGNGCGYAGRDHDGSPIFLRSTYTISDTRTAGSRLDDRKYMPSMQLFLNSGDNRKTLTEFFDFNEPDGIILIERHQGLVEEMLKNNLPNCKDI